MISPTATIRSPTMATSPAMGGRTCAVEDLSPAEEDVGVDGRPGFGPGRGPHR